MKLSTLILLPLSLILLLSCGKDDSDDKYPGNLLFISANIDGQQVKIQEGVRNFVYNEIFEISSAEGIRNYSRGFIFRPQSSYDSAFTITVGKFYTEDQSVEELKSFWRVGTYSYVTGTSPGNKQAFVGFTDANGQRWTSQVEPEQQAGNTFVVTKVTPYQNGERAQLVEGTFSCRLYLLQSTEYKTITNGKFKAIVPFRE